MPPWCNSRNILFGHVLVRLRGELLVGQVWPHVITIHSSPNGLPRVCLGIICLEITNIYPIVLRLSTDCLETASGLPLDCKLPAFALPGVCLGIASGLPLDCKRPAFALPGVCLGIASGLPFDCKRSAFALPGVCLGIAQRLPWDCLGAGNGSRNIARVMFWGMLVGVSWDCLATAREFEVI